MKYLILNKQNLIAEISDNAVYVKHQDNGVDIIADVKTADRIYSNDTDVLYPCDEYTLLKVDMVPDNIVAGYYYCGGNFYADENPLIALIRAKTPRQEELILMQTENIENALCDMDMATETRLAEIENVLCEIDMGGVN